MCSKHFMCLYHDFKVPLLWVVVKKKNVQFHKDNSTIFAVAPGISLF